MRVCHSRLIVLMIAAALTLSACLPQGAGPPRSPAQPPDIAPAASSVQHDASLGHWPLLFVANRGQFDPRVGYYAPGQKATTYFTSTGLTYVIDPGGMVHATRDTADDAANTRWTLAADFVGGNPDAAPVGQDLTDGTFNYFHGSENQWVTAVPTYRGVGYANVWPGIDAHYGDRDGHLEYDLTLQPGADPARIAVAYRGATAARLTEAGDVEIEAGSSRLVEGAPYAYQDIDSQRVEVPASFTLDDDAELGQYTVGFQLGAYDPSQPLVIDPPVVVFAGYVGGESNDEGLGVTVDSAGNVYLVGTANALMAGQTIGIPTAVGPDLTQNGNQDAYIAKVKADGTGLVYAGFIGGTGNEGGFTLAGGMGVAVDSGGSAYVTGRTTSKPTDGFPITTGAFDNTLGGTQDAFIAKVKPDGTALTYATYFGGDGIEEGVSLAIDSSGNAYITGYTDSGTNFPVTTGAAQGTYGGLEDGFIAKLNTDGSKLVYASFIGGADNDRGRGITVDASGNAYVVGTTKSTAATFPKTVGPSLALTGGTDAFIAKVAPDGKAFTYAGYIGGTKDEEGLAVAVDRTCTTACPAYVAGNTQSKPDATEKFPAVLGPSLTFGGTTDGFVAKVKGDGTGLVYAGYIGGSQNDNARGIGIDGAGFAYLTGDTASNQTQGFPLTANAFDNTYGGNGDSFIAKVKPDGSGFSLVSYLGGDGADFGFGLAADASGNAYAMGETTSTATSFPLKTGPFTVYRGGEDFWIAKVATAADVSITKTASPTSGTIGQPLTYTLTASNAGPLAATNVTITDVLPAGIDFVTATPSTGTCAFTAATRTVSCPLGNVAAGANATVALVVSLSQTGTINNTASVTLAEDDPSASNNSASSSTQIDPAPTLCSPRPKVTVSVVPSGAGKVHVTLQANNTSFGNVLQKVTYGAVLNATVITSSQTGAGGFTVNLPPGTQQYQFDVQRVTAGQGATAQFVVTDACGDWQTFAGLGTAVP